MDATPIAIVAGDRTPTASGPTVKDTRAVRSPIAVASANASYVAISPTHSSSYPSSSATVATSSASPAGRSGQ